MTDKNGLAKSKSMERRDFLKKSSILASIPMIVPISVLGGRHIAPSDQVRLAFVGVGGRGKSVLDGCMANPHARLVALCDVDRERALEAREEHEEAPFYQDFRKICDNHLSEIDGIVVCTPDHTHAVAAVPFMRAGKHAYVEKPLTHNIAESRLMTEIAVEKEIVTQMGNQGSSDEGVLHICEWIESGLIGEVGEVHCWTNRPVWPQGIATPVDKQRIPKTLDWDLWLGPASYRPYNEAYLPTKWRGWWDFGTGALGDMGCHMMEPPFRALKLGYPTEVEASVTNVWQEFFVEADYPDSCPPSSIVHLLFPARADMPPVKLTWYDGGILPKRPEELGADELFGCWDGGVLFVGSEGKILCDTYGRNPRLLPSSRQMEESFPEPTLPRIEGSHQDNWIHAILGKDRASSSFDIAGPLSETVLMGNLAIRAAQYKVLLPGKTASDWAPYDYPGQKKMYWDGTKMQITNLDMANDFVGREYRSGWSLD